MRANLILEFKANSGIAFDEAWSPAGDLLVVAGLDDALYAREVGSGKQVLTVPHSELRVWDARTGEARGGLADHRDFIASVAYSPDGRLLASASSDSTVRIWDLSVRAYAAVLDEFDRWWVEGMSFSPDGRHLATIDQTGNIRVWQLDTQQVVLTLQAGGFNKTVNWSPDGRHLASGGPNTERVWTLVR